MADTALDSTGKKALLLLLWLHHCITKDIIINLCCFEGYLKVGKHMHYILYMGMQSVKDIKTQYLH